MKDQVTVCLTSCNRPDLLKKTLDSFFSTNSYPIEKIIVTEDSCNPSMKDFINKNYGSKVQLIFNEVNLGPFKSIDNMYNLVTTEYIFHSEDDWQYHSNPNFIKESMNILKERDDIHQVWIRSTKEFNDWIEPAVCKTKQNTSYKVVKNPHLGGWCGFSFNPGLRRLSDYKKMFPNGYTEFFEKDKFWGLSELNCNYVAAKQGYRAAILMNPACIHIGHGRTTL